MSLIGHGAANPPSRRCILTLAVLLLRHRHYRPDGTDITRYAENVSLYAEESAEVVAAQCQAVKILDALEINLDAAIREVEVAGANWDQSGDTRVPIAVLRSAGAAFEKELSS